MAAQNPQQEEERLLRRWLRRRHPDLRKNGDVVLLPKRIVCFGKRLQLSLPADFRVDGQRADGIAFAGQQTGLTLSVLSVPFRRPLQSVSAVDLQMAFSELSLPSHLPELRRGFLRHSPTVTAEWSGAPAHEKTVLHLIQVQKTVFLLLFRNVTAETEPYVQAMIYAASVAQGQ